jgi:hypothetical protein
MNEIEEVKNENPLIDGEDQEQQEELEKKIKKGSEKLFVISFENFVKLIFEFSVI